MSAMYTLLQNTYQQTIEEIRENTEVLTWPLMSSPYPVLGIAALYLLFVLGVGPRLMRNREPFDLKLVIAGYNAYQVLFNLWLATWPLRNWNLVNFHDRGCAPIEIASVPSSLMAACYWYVMSKIVDLLDTVFYVLRKKHSQVTFLHVYHHTLIVITAWAMFRYTFVEHGMVTVVVNSAVHVVMYAYYLLAAMGPAVQKHLWWKKYITAIQLTQFLILFAFNLFLVVYDCKLPTAVSLVNMLNLVFFVYLFGQFYRQTYLKVTPRDQNQGANGRKSVSDPAVSNQVHGYHEKSK